MMMIAGAIVWIAAAGMYAVRPSGDAYIWPGVIGTGVVLLGVLKDFTEFKAKAVEAKDR